MTDIEEAKTLKCSICGETILPDAKGWSGGHNAAPINDGRCCSDCNATKVVPERLRLLIEKKTSRAL